MKGEPIVLPNTHLYIRKIRFDSFFLCIQLKTVNADLLKYSVQAALESAHQHCLQWKTGSGVCRSKEKKISFLQSHYLASVVQGFFLSQVA